jgi:hypothetical protein
MKLAQKDQDFWCLKKRRLGSDYFPKLILSTWVTLVMKSKGEVDNHSPGAYQHHRIFSGIQLLLYGLYQLPADRKRVLPGDGGDIEV